MEMRANTFQPGLGMDSQQQFCLKWNSFGSNLATAFSNLFKSESLADVTLFCEGVSFRAHKLILAACSKYLADLFETAPLFQNVLVILDGTSAANMSALLEFMYKGEVHVSQESLSSFLKAAEYLQVKGLSIEHEKLAVAQSQHAQEASVDSPSRKHRLSSSGSKEECDTSHGGLYHHVPSPSSYNSSVMSPYISHHYNRSHEQRINSQTGNIGTGNYESPRKRPLRSPSEMLQEAASVRASVLRDGKSAASRPGSPCAGSSGPLPLGYRPSSSSSSSLPPQPEADAPPEHKYEPPEVNSTATTGNTTFDRTAVVKSENPESRRHSEETNFPEDLRMKMDPNNTPPDELMVTNSSASGNPVTGNVGTYTTANGTTQPNDPPPIMPDDNKFRIDNIWNSVTGKLCTKAGSVATPDGKKLKCPFCERLYGYETNLRAHIRQRHQGIRVPCPFCTRTFTRNNTVRRHIAREHKNELSMKTFQQTQQTQQVHNHNQ